MRSRSRILTAALPPILAGCLFLVGCSPLINYCGKDIKKLKTREQVHQSMGVPRDAGMNDELTSDLGVEFEDYRTHVKISEPDAAINNLVFDLETFGLIEFFLFPDYVWQFLRSSAVGQTVRFHYDKNGNVNHIEINRTLMQNRASLP